MTATCNTCQPLVKTFNQSMPAEYRQFMIEQKAAQYRATSGAPSGLLTKGVRAIFDPNLGPSGGYRCPEGTQFGGQVTDRFGRNCGRGIIRRLGRGLLKLGDSVQDIANGRDRSRLERAVRRRTAPDGQGRIGRAVGAIERGAQRLVGDYEPGDGGRRNRRNLPGGPANRISAVPRKPRRERIVPDGAERKPRRQGRNPKEGPVNARMVGALERAAQRVLGEEDRKPRSRGRNVPEPDVPSVKPSVKPDNKDRFDWDSLNKDQKDEIEKVADEALESLEEEMRKYMFIGKDGFIHQDLVDRFLERKKQSKDFKKYEDDAYKWQQLHTSWNDNPSQAINAINWTDDERQKIRDIFDMKPESVKPESVKPVRRTGADFWERRKNREPKLIPPPANSEPELIADIIDNAPEVDTETTPPWLKALEAVLIGNIDQMKDSESSLEFLENKFKDELERYRKLHEDDKSNKNWLQNMQMYQGLLNRIDKNKIALRVRREREAKPKAPTPIPTPKPVKSKPVQRIRKGDIAVPNDDAVISALKVDSPREEVIGAFAEEFNEPGRLPIPQDIKNDEIKDLADAVKWLRDGKPLTEVPQEYWFDAVQAASDTNLVGVKPRYKQLQKQGGAIKGVAIYELLDDNGKGTGTGIVFNYDTGAPANNAGEVIVQNLMHALGMNVAPARYDGLIDSEGWDLDENDRFQRMPKKVRVNAMPFAWNRAPKGNVQKPRGANQNYNPALFDGLPNKGYQQRLAHMLGNFMAQIGDRHDGNGMNGLVGEQPYIVPIDFGFFNMNFQGLKDYAAGNFWMDPRLIPEIGRHIRTIGDESERTKFQKEVMDVFDGMLMRADAIVKRGKDAFVADHLAGAHNQSDKYQDGIRERAERQFNFLQRAVDDMKAERADVFGQWGIKDVQPLGELPKPAPKQASVPETPAPKLENAIKALVVAPPKKRNKRAPLLAKPVDANDVLPKPVHAVNPEIKTKQDAVKWLDDGKSITELPQEYWAYALNMHVNGNATKKQYKEITPTAGAIKTTKIYLALDDDGNALQQGFVVAYEGGPNKWGQNDANNATEMIVANMMHALGLNVEPARFDGGDRRGAPAVVIPLAWNMAPDGNLQVPKDIYSYYSDDEVQEFAQQMFDRVPDRALPQRIGAFLGNFIFAVVDRHDQNQMGGLVDGKHPHIVPIDMGFAGEYGWADMVEAEGQFDLDYGLFEEIRGQFRGLTPKETEEQYRAIMDVYDGMTTRLDAIVALGEQAFADRMIEFLSPEQMGNNIAKTETRRKAEEMFSLMERSLKDMKKKRDFFISLMRNPQ